MRGSRIRFAFGIAIVFAIVLSTAICWAADEKKEATGKGKDKGVSAERGNYLVNGLSGCGDCHTPWAMTPNGPEPDQRMMLSGHPAAFVISSQPKFEEPWAWGSTGTMTAFAGPWGVSYSMNLTQDMETGMGAWTETAFVGALKTGMHMGTGRPILPPMPWMVYRNMTDDDLKSIYAYLKTVPAIKNAIPDPIAPPTK